MPAGPGSRPGTVGGVLPDGTTLATGSNDGTVRLWQTATGCLLAALHPLSQGDWATVLPDGTYKTSGGDSRSLLWWAVKLRRFELDELADLDPAYQPLDPATPIPGLDHLPHSPLPSPPPPQGPPSPPPQPHRPPQPQEEARESRRWFSRRRR